MNQIAANEKVGNSADAGDMLDLGRLARTLGFLLRMAQVEIFESFEDELGEHGLKPGEFSVFWLVGQHPGVRQGRVARSLAIKQAHMTKLVRRLEAQGLIERAIPDNDRRSVLLNVTERGKAFLEEVQDNLLGNNLVKNSALSKVETKTLIGLLQKLTGIQEAGGQ